MGQFFLQILLDSNRSKMIFSTKFLGSQYFNVPPIDPQNLQVISHSVGTSHQSKANQH